MSLGFFRWVLGAVIALELVASFFLPNGAGSLGVSAEWANDAYRFAAGSSVWAVALSVLNALLYLALMKWSVASEGKPLTGVFKRWIAFWIDFIWVMTSAAPVVGLLPVFLEAKRTGHFVWAFERDTKAAGDVPVAIFAGLAILALVLFYFALPVLCARPSPGACLLGYQILPEDGKTPTLAKAVQRSLIGFVAVCGAPLAPFVGGDKLIKSWLDERFGVKAVTLK